MPNTNIEFLNLFFAGILAGEELVVCYGVRPLLADMEEQPQFRLRQALIRRLRVLVPAIYLLTTASWIAVMVLERGSAGLGFRCAGALALLSWTLVTFGGTVPINKRILTWQADAPPIDWRVVVRRWERLDIARCWAAAFSFAFALAAAALNSAANAV
jgi:hypothetical protein